MYKRESTNTTDLQLGESLGLNIGKRFSREYSIYEQYLTYLRQVRLELVTLRS